MTLHLPPNDILLALLLATVLILLAAGADLPPDEGPTFERAGLPRSSGGAQNSSRPAVLEAAREGDSRNADEDPNA